MIGPLAIWPKGRSIVNAVCQLEREWQALAPGAVAEALPRWRAQQPALRRFASPQQLLRFLHAARSGETDAPLLALLSLARRDRLAGRLLLQAILPALRAQAERIVHERERREELWELLLFFAWEAICGYPTAERRFRVAANLVLQVLHDTTRELQRSTDPTDERPARGLSHTLGTVPAAALDQPADANERPAPIREADAEALVLAAVAAGAISERDAQLILQTRVDGIGLRLIARVLGVGYDALRKRRQRAESQLRALLAANCDVPKTSVLVLTVSRGTILRAAPPAQTDRRPVAGGLVAATCDAA